MAQVDVICNTLFVSTERVEVWLRLLLFPALLLPGPTSRSDPDPGEVFKRNVLSGGPAPLFAIRAAVSTLVAGEGSGTLVIVVVLGIVLVPEVVANLHRQTLLPQGLDTV